MRIDEVSKPPTWIRMGALSSSNKSDPLASVEAELNNSVTSAGEEVAMIHPFNTSTIKIKNNGMIDAFVATDQGIRIDPSSKTVNILSDGMKEHVNYFRAWVTKDLEWWAKSSFLFNSEQSSFTVNAYTDINLIAGRNITIKAKGNLNLSGAKIYVD